MFEVEDGAYDQHDAPRVPIPDLYANVDLSVDVRNIPLFLLPKMPTGEHIRSICTSFAPHNNNNFAG